MKTEQSKNEGLPAGSLQGYAVTGAAITSAEVAALEVLRETGVEILEAALIAKSALEAGRGRVKRARECIEPLTKEEIERVMSAAESYDGGSCLAATAIMLYAGVRPHECERLRWRDVCLDDACQAGVFSEREERRMGVIVIAPQHSKTGGARCVTIHPPLAKILRVIRQAPDAPICPPNWRRHWAGLHREAGFTPWQPDVLRHTFATHHLATFRSYTELQLEMGHRSAELLRTRYVAMEGIYRRGESILVG